MDTDAPFITTASTARPSPREMEVIWGMAGEAGFRPKISAIDYNTEWRTKYTAPASRDQLGKFTGATAQLASTSSRIWMWALLNSAGSFYRGFDADGSGSAKGDPKLDQMTSDLLKEFDQDKAFKLAHDIQRREAEMAYPACSRAAPTASGWAGPRSATSASTARTAGSRRSSWTTPKAPTEEGLALNKAEGRLRPRRDSNAEPARQRPDVQVGPGTPMGNLMRQYWIPASARTSCRRRTARRCACVCWAKTSSPSARPPAPSA